MWDKAPKVVPDIKSSIFTRILAASLLPLLAVFSMVLLVISGVVFSVDAESTKEMTLLLARRMKIQMEEKILALSDALPVAGHALEMLDVEDPASKKEAEEILRTLFNSNTDICNVWFAFEPGEFSKTERFSRSYLRSGDVAVEVFDMPDSLLDDPKRSPWYNAPQSTGQLFRSQSGYYDYGTGPQYVSAVSFPLSRKGRIVGSIGFDVAYDRLFHSIDDMRLPEQYMILLLSDTGKVIYSPIGRYGDRTLLNFPFLAPGKINASLGKSIFIGERKSPFSGILSLICLYPLSPESENSPFLYIELPVSALYSRAFNATRAIAVISVLGLVVLAISVFFAVRNVVRPIKRITNNAHRLAMGDLDIVFDTIDESGTTHDEVTVLQIALKKMLVRIYQARELELQALRAGYEKEKSEETMRAKVRFFASISHEIRTPMNAIQGLSELLLEESLTPKQRRYVNDIRISTDSLLDVVNDVLDFSKMETDRIEMNCDDFDFRALLDNICTIVSTMTRKKSLAFETVFAAEVPGCLHGDSVKIRQVLLNLLGNAVKYTPAGFIRLTVSYEDGELFIEVADSGIGIREEDMPLIFEAFRQLPQEKEHHIQGTGLGLTITKRLVTLMGGEISVRSVCGEGSVFSVRVPVPPGSGNVGADNGEKLNIRMPTVRVLVVDDNEINLSVAEGLLARFGMTPDTAVSGKKALSMIQSTDYDIVFMDHMMPGMDGIETTQRIRNMGGRYERLIIVALTANAVIGTKEMLLQKGMNDFLSKPVNRRTLGNMLLKWLPIEKVDFGDLENVDENADAVSNSEMPQPIARLFAIRELDVPLGLSRVSRSVELFEKIVKQMNVALPRFCEEIRELLREQDCENFKIKVHAMKASLANIGATELSLQAQKLEQAANSKNLASCRSDLDDFLDRMTTFGQALRLALNGCGGTAKAAGDPALLHAGIQRLYDALADNDYTAVLATMQELFGYDFGKEDDDALLRLRDLVDSFEYEAAAGAIRTRWPDIAKHS